MSLSQISYLFLLSICLILSIFCHKSDKSLNIFPLLLGVSLIVEIAVDVMYFLLNCKNEYNIIYHIYIPIEYTILAYYFYLNNKDQIVKKFIILSVPLFVLASSVLSISVISTTEFPGLNFNFSGILLIIWSLITLFSIPPVNNQNITRIPVFWICVGILIFHPGIFFFNGVYEYIQHKNSSLAQQLHLLIIKSLNYILYLCFIVAFLCSQRMKKYLLR